MPTPYCVVQSSVEVASKPSVSLHCRLSLSLSLSLNLSLSVSLRRRRFANLLLLIVVISITSPKELTNITERDGSWNIIIMIVVVEFLDTLLRWATLYSVRIPSCMSGL